MIFSGRTECEIANVLSQRLRTFSVVSPGSKLVKTFVSQFLNLKPYALFVFSRALKVEMSSRYEVGVT